MKEKVKTIHTATSVCSVPCVYLWTHEVNLFHFWVYNKKYNKNHKWKPDWGFLLYLFIICKMQLFHKIWLVTTSDVYYGTLTGWLQPSDYTITCTWPLHDYYELLCGVLYVITAHNYSRILVLDNLPYTCYIDMSFRLLLCCHSYWDAYWIALM